MISFLRDLRYSVRSLGRSPGLAAALLVTVAVGVGANATVAGFINGLLTRDLALPDAPRLASIYWRDAGDRYDPVPYQGYLSLRQAASSFEGIAAFRESRANVTVNKHWAWMSIVAASPEIWPVAGVAPALGRMTFTDEGHDPSSIGVVISHRVWRNEFAGKPDAIGADIVVNGRGGHVVGVAPEWFEGLYIGRDIDAWVPLDEEAAAKRPVWVLGRLRAKTALGDSQGQVTEITGEKPGAVVTRYTGIEPEIQLKLTRLESLLGWAAALVFLTAAANVAGFLLSRAARRTHETATRIAVGATRLRLAAHIVADGVVISLGGAVLGVFVASWTAGALPALLYTEDAERLRLMPEPWQVAGSAAGYAAIMLLCSLAPIARIDKLGAMTTLRRTGEGAITPVGWMRSLLVVAQMSVCVILVIGAALLFEGFRDALRTARGGQMGEPIVARLEAAARFARPAEGQAYFQQSEHEVFGMRGVTSVAWVSTLPGGRPLGSTFTLERPAAGTSEVIIDTVTPAGADLLKLTMKSGRPFAGRDGPFSCPVAIVNEAAADEYFEGRAVGRAMHDSSGRRIDIIGVADAIGEKAAEPRIYFYERQALAPPSRDVMPRRFTVPISQAPPESADIDVNVASSGYFDLVEASFPSGHGFDAASQSNSCGVVVVNREAAQAYFDDNAVGGAVIDGDGSRSEIIGVVDAGALRVMQRRADPAVYFPMAQRYVPLMTLIAATPAARPELVAEIAKRLAAVPGGREPPKVLTLEEHLARTALGPERVATLLVTASALVALGLALLGVYGVMSDAVLQKKREIALKLALGAQARAIIAGVFRDGIRIAAAGGGVGLVLSWILVQWVLHTNAGFQAPSWWAWLACPLVLIMVVGIASVLPARWALAVDPITITRENG